MRIFNKMLTIIIASIVMTTMFSIYSSNLTNANSQVVEGKPVSVAVLFYRFNNEPYVSLLRQNFEKIQIENKDKVKFTFYDGEDNQAIQNRSIDKLLESRDADIIFLDLVDTKNVQEIINKIKENNIPVVIFHREPLNIESVKSYNKAFYVGGNPEEAGRLEGKIIIDAWNKEKEIIDKNGDNIMQYVMLFGERDNLDAIGRTRYSLSAIHDAGINTEEIALKVCNWDENLAENTIKTIFLQQGNKIETIISNNDSMAIGAIKALQKYGYNEGDKVKTIPVVGVDAIPQAQEFIKKGYMAGSVLQDATAMVKAVYTIGMNLVYDRLPLDGTVYKVDDTGVAIRIPYKEYTDNLL